MTIKLTTQPRPRALAWAIFCATALSACGGGSGGGMVRSPAPTVPPSGIPPSPTSPAAFNPCPTPVTSDCVVSVPAGSRQNLPQADSAFSLIVRGGELGLVADTYRFGGGTAIENGWLGVGTGHNAENELTVLRSNVMVEAPASLFISSRVVGNIDNAGTVTLYGTIEGNLANRGLLGISAAQYGNPVAIIGDFSQSATGTLAFALSPAGWDSPAALNVSGRATLGGTLLLQQYTDWAGPYALPASGAHQILHADGGVFGTFDRWISPGLFIEGSLRYGSNDVWFDLSRISVQTAMSGQGFGGVTLASAGNLDRALAVADGFAAAPAASLNPAQQGFLQSASRLLWVADLAQAQRSLDSLSGRVHADALQRARQGGAMAAATARHLSTLSPGAATGQWSQLGADGTVAGFDQWLGPRLLLGSAAATGGTSTDGGQARDRAAQAALYLRWFGDDGWYAGGSAGYSRHALNIDRPIELGDGRSYARSQRGLGVATLDAEVGRGFAMGGGVLSPYAGLSADVVRSERTLEQGRTGFELALQANTQARLAASLGLRYGKRWQFGEGSWLQLDADAGYGRDLAQAGPPLQATFIGVPEVDFAILGDASIRATWLNLGLRGGFGREWNWSLSHSGALAGTGNDRNWMLGLQRRF